MKVPDPPTPGENWRQTEAIVLCPKCDHEMQRGWLADAFTVGAVLKPRWFAGKPWQTWGGGIIQPAKKETFEVATFRCVRCGYLESYAYKEE